MPIEGYTRWGIINEGCGGEGPMEKVLTPRKQIPNHKGSCDKKYNGENRIKNGGLGSP